METAHQTYILVMPVQWKAGWATGQMYYTLRGHMLEIVCLSFNPQSTVIATGSMDNTAKLWDVETGAEKFTLGGHQAEIVSLGFNQSADLLITGSFDHTSRIWDVRMGKCVHILEGHTGEVRPNFTVL